VIARIDDEFVFDGAYATRGLGDLDRDAALSEATDGASQRDRARSLRHCHLGGMVEAGVATVPGSNLVDDLCVGHRIAFLVCGPRG
jgi:hypothetical protein